MVIVVRLCQLGFVHQQIVKPVATTQFEILIHLDRLEWTDFDANLAAHAHRNVDIEHSWVKLRLTHIVRFFVITLGDVDALRRTFLLANLARHASQTGFGIVAVVNQEWKIPIIFRERVPLFRVLNGDQSFRYKIAADEVSRRNRHSLEYSRAEHDSIRS